VPPNFLKLADIREGIQLKAAHYLPADEILTGLLGNVLPLFRCRDAISQCVFGIATLELPQQQYDKSLPSNLEDRAQAFASRFQKSDESDFQKKAFENFIARCQQANRKVILLSGSYNPLLSSRIEPAVHEEMLKFLSDLRDRYSVVRLVPAADLIRQTPSDYEDLNHVNRETQQRFTAALAGLISQFLSQDANRN
jgi:hypothetical protein